LNKTGWDYNRGMRSMPRLASTALLGAALMMVGCSSPAQNPDGATSSGPKPTDKLVSLSPTDLHNLCLQESANGTGAVSCGDAGAVAVALGVCTSLQPDCSATVATLQTCTAKLSQDACDYKAYTADLATPECLVMQACTNVLCGNSFCFCPDNNSLTQCTTSCKNITKGLGIDCASCLAPVLSETSMCPDFTKLPAPYDQCPATCAAHGG
jgi:hypothetical protein